MSAIILFQCRACEGEITFSPRATSSLECPHCHKSVPVRVDPALIDQNLVRACVACGHDTLYVQKDFNRSLGLAVVIAGVLTSVIFFARDEPLLAMVALFVMAGIDLLIYLAVGEVTVCYACHAVYRGFRKNPAHEPFDLKNLEKYGGREPRF